MEIQWLLAIALYPTTIYHNLNEGKTRTEDRLTITFLTNFWRKITSRMIDEMVKNCIYLDVYGQLQIQHMYLTIMSID